MVYRFYNIDFLLNLVRSGRNNLRFFKFCNGGEGQSVWSLFASFREKFSFTLRLQNNDIIFSLIFCHQPRAVLSRC